MSAPASGSNPGGSTLSRVLQMIAFVAISFLGFAAMVSGTYEPTIGWIAVSALPALFVARYLTLDILSRKQFKRSPLYGPPDRSFYTIALGLFFFLGSYIFVCMFVGSAITLAAGHSQLREATLISWSRPHRGGRRNHRCPRVHAVIDTSERRHVSFCFPQKYSFSIRSGSTIWLHTYESAMLGHLVEPKVYLPTFRPRSE